MHHQPRKAFYARRKGTVIVTAMPVVSQSGVAEEQNTVGVQHFRMLGPARRSVRWRRRLGLGLGRRCGCRVTETRVWGVPRRPATRRRVGVVDSDEAERAGTAVLQFDTADLGPPGHHIAHAQPLDELGLAAGPHSLRPWYRRENVVLP